MAHRVLFMEDDASIGQTLSDALKLSGLSVTWKTTVKAALKCVHREKWDLLLLDVNLPDGKGYQVCTEARLLNPRVPILMLSANVDEESAIRAFSGGALDYLRKPVGPREILLRIQRAMGLEAIIEFGSVQISRSERRVRVDDREVELRRREFEILVALASKPGEVLKREDLLEAIRVDEGVTDRAIDSHLSRLRKKLREAGAKDIEISSVYGVGYSFKKAG